VLIFQKMYKSCLVGISSFFVALLEMGSFQPYFVGCEDFLTMNVC